MKQKILYILALLFATLQTSAQTYTYDNLNRLTKVVYDNGTTITYSFDALGNRTSKKVIGATAETYTISIDVSPSGSGTVTGGGTYAKGTSIELKAIPNVGYEFLKWSDGNKDNPRTVTVTKNISYTAQFKESDVTPELIGDIVVDGKVNQQDLNALVNAYLSGASATKVTDLDHDQLLSIADITTLIAIINDNSIPLNNNGHQYIDLGLPSGTLWATCNVGASAPEESGNLYAWGETKTKDIYNWETYEWCNGTVCNNLNNTLTKYCVEGGYGTVDGKAALEIDDDVAHAQWGGDWHIPTETDVLELIDNCESKWETINGVNGRTFIGKNGNSIFLPAAGGKEEDEYYSGVGQYWTSTLLTGDHSTYAKLLWFTRNRIERSETVLYSTLRYYGLTVRPVISEKNSEKQNEATPSSYKNHDLVDLGLPSRTLWATCNLGASSPEGYGCYYAWADTESSCDGKTFNEETYKYYSQSGMTKYTAVGVLENSDDAATVQWGGSWRMPTRTEITELENSDYTTSEWTTVNGIYGCRFTSIVDGYKGNSIFLPAAGYYKGDQLKDAGEQGLYWGASIRLVSEDYPYESADCIRLSDGYYSKGAASRWKGYSIRPVVSLDAINK